MPFALSPEPYSLNPMLYEPETFRPKPLSRLIPTFPKGQLKCQLLDEIIRGSSGDAKEDEVHPIEDEEAGEAA